MKTIVHKPFKSQNIHIVSRHNARCYALQALYQWQVAGGEINEIEMDFLHHYVRKKLDLNYFKELIYGVHSHQSRIDQAMQPFLHRALYDVDPVELSVLRLAIYELMERHDIPYRVVINEALELTKTFGSIEGHKFVNGILDRVARENRTTEM